MQTALIIGIGIVFGLGIGWCFCLMWIDYLMKKDDFCNPYEKKRREELKINENQS